jgi:hypothetical protein
MERQTYTVNETAEILGIGRNKAYEGINDGTIPHITAQSCGDTLETRY